MKKLFISLLLILSASFMFADTLHIFIPKVAGHSDIYYEELIYENMIYDVGSGSKKNGFWTRYGGLLLVQINGKLYKYNCQWYAEPDKE